MDIVCYQKRCNEKNTVSVRFLSKGYSLILILRKYKTTLNLETYCIRSLTYILPQVKVRKDKERLKNSSRLKEIKGDL